MRDNINAPLSYKLFSVRKLVIKEKKISNIYSKQVKVQYCYIWNVIIHKVYQVPFYVGTLRALSFCKLSLNSSVRESKSSFPTTITNFVVGWIRTWVKPGIFLATTWSVTARKTFLPSISILKILAIDYWFLWYSCWNSNISSTVKFSICFCQFCLGCRSCRNSFLHLFQKCAAMCWTHCHLFFFFFEQTSV